MHHNVKGSNCPLYRPSLSVPVVIPARCFPSFRQALQSSSPRLSFCFISLVHIYRLRIVNRTPIPMSSLMLTMMLVDSLSQSVIFIKAHAAFPSLSAIVALYVPDSRAPHIHISSTPSPRPLTLALNGPERMLMLRTVSREMECSSS